MTEPINYGIGGKEVMPEYRFNVIKSVFPFAFQDSEAKTNDDPWWMIRGLVDCYKASIPDIVSLLVYYI